MATGIGALMLSFHLVAAAGAASTATTNRPPAETLGSINFVKVPVSDVLRIYATLANVELKYERAVPGVPITFHGGNLTKAESLSALEKALRKQAGVILKPIDPTHVSVNYDPSVMQKP